MKLLLVFAFVALMCMARSAPSTTTARILVFQDYNDREETEPIADAHDVETDVADEEDEDESAETTTTTTTRRPAQKFPTRNPNLIPSRRTTQTLRPSSTFRATTPALDDDDEEQDDQTNNYDGDFKYIRDFRKYVQQLLDDLKKIVRNLTGYEIGKTTQRGASRNQNNY